MGSFNQAEAGAKVDVYFLADSTGSMGSQLDSMKKNASSIMERLRAADADVQLGVGNYKDFSHGDKPFVSEQAITNDPGLITKAINGWQAGGGGQDVAEGQLYALDQLASSGNGIGWRPGAQRIVVWFGDAPGHDPICKAISGLPYDITEESVTDNLKAQRIRVVALSTPSGLDDDPRGSRGYVSQCGEPGGRPGQASRIAAATGGSHTLGVNADAIADTIVKQIHTQISNAPLRRPMPPTNVPQLIVHSASGLFITPYGHNTGAVEVRLWRGELRTKRKQDMWELHLQQNGLVRIKNADYARYLTIREKGNIVYQDNLTEDHGQLWRLVQADPAQADLVIASARDEQLVISPVEGCHRAETTLEVAELGPWADQFWHWYRPRG